MGRLRSDQGVCVRNDDDDGWRIDDDGSACRVPKVIVNSNSPFERDQRRRLFEDGMRYYKACQRLLRNSLG